MRTSDTPHETNEDAAPSTSALETIQRDSYSRSRFLKLAGGAGVAGAMSILLAACGDDSDSGSSDKMKKKPKDKPKATMSGQKGDLEIVNYALTLEYVEADFYAAVVASGLFKGAQLEAIKVIGQHEQEHVDALLATAKSMGTPAAKPETTFPLEDAKSVLALAAVVESLGAAAYLGQAGRIEDPEILAAALAIHSVEARHAAALARLTGTNPLPDGAFAKPATMEEVLPQVKPFLVA